MKASCGVFRPLPCFSGAGIDACSRSSSKPSLSGLSVDGGNRFRCCDLRIYGSRESSTVRKLSGFSRSGFCDNSHVQYYYGSAIICGSGKKDKDITAKKKMMKKRLKLLKGLSKDLSMFSEMGFGLHTHNHELVDQVKGKMISEASDLLLTQLQQLRAEEKELKRKGKEEKAKLKANRIDCEQCEESSRSSSESSDSECGGEVVDMSHLKSQALAPPVVNELQEATLTLPSTHNREGSTTEFQPGSIIQKAILTIPSTTTKVGKATEERGMECSSQNLELERCCTPTSSTTTTCSNNYIGIGSCYDGGRSSVVQAAASAKKVEVCMGGKCKKSGSTALLEEFRRVLGGAEGAVVGCKCMGKCRDGPNVRVLNCSYEPGVQAQGLDDSVRTPTTNPLCIGVGFEDVGLIVSNFFGETHQDLGLTAAAATATS